MLERTVAGNPRLPHGGTHYEGYVLCSGTTPLAWDIGSSESGWAAGGIVIAGPSATAITLRRVTTDGLWQLDQKIQADKKELDITITMTMTLTNLGLAAGEVRMARVVDFDNDNDFGDDTQDRTDRSVTAREVHGLSLTNTKFGQPVDTAVTFASASCSSTSVSTPTTTDGYSNVTARLGNIGVGKKATTILRYGRY
jgi:hypothetical protein